MTYTKYERISRLLQFDEIKIGDEAELVHHLSQADMETFAALTGDFNPLHLDETFARKTMFRKPVVYGMLSASFISTIIGMLLPGRGSLWTSQTLEFLYPGRVGDTIYIKSRVKQKSLGTRTIVLETVINNQHGQQLIKGVSTIKMLEIADEDKVAISETAKTILVTGGSRGIGAATARILAENGHRVIVNYIRAKEEAELVVSEIVGRGGQAIAIQANVAEMKEVTALFSTIEQGFGAVQALVHCAATGSELRSFEDLTWDMVQRQLDVQLRGGFNCTKMALPNMIEAQSGAIVFIGSIAADNVPPAQQTDYVVAKSALTALARCLAVEYGVKGIRINVVAPGMTQTDMITNLPDKAKILTRMQTPLRRLADPIDIANVIAFLLSPMARHITGETVRVSGGMVMV